VAADVENTLNDLIDRVGRVRRWLVALGVLKTAAIGLACLSLYIGLYAWIDHHAHFGHVGRLWALFILLALLALLGWLLVRAIRRSMTYAYAANYVEDKQSFDQQLVAAVEYFERRDNYPYSRALAEQLVLQVDEATRDFPFDSTVDKRRGYILAALILLGIFIVGLFIRQNVLYFSSYLSRLLNPLAQIEPVPATVLESLTEDIVTPPDEPVTFTAQVEGRTPESVALVLTRREPNDVNEVTERIELSPTLDPNGRTTFTTARSFDSTGDLSYHFEAQGTSSEAHEIKVREPPAIRDITATISPPGAAAYSRQVEDGTLDVLPGSRVALQVACTTPLREAAVSTPGREPVVQTLDATDTFGFDFQADADSAIDFQLTSTDGLANREPQQVNIVLKADAPPQFKLLSPEGDCLATNVASIPITFEITDDFGLDSVQLYCELPDRSPIPIDEKIVHGDKNAVVAHTLELEQYDLKVGDSVLFYTGASDIDTGQVRTNAACCSDVYLIEIRPYQQYWRPLPGSNQPSSMPGMAPEDLITILEYTRAVLKKTWTLVHGPQPTSETMSRLDALRKDVEYCEQTLAKTRDDPENKFSEAQKAKLRDIGQRYTAADGRLGLHDADGALPPTRDAYRLLRQFIDELNLNWTPPQSGQSVPEDKPERVKLQEEPRSPEMDEQRIESQMEKLQRKIESLAREQKSLSSSLDKALQQDQAAGEGQPSESSSSHGESGQSASSEGQQSSSSSSGSGSSQGPSTAGQPSGESSPGSADKQTTSQNAQSDSTTQPKKMAHDAPPDGQAQTASNAGSDEESKAASPGNQGDGKPQSAGDSQASGQAGSQGGKGSSAARSDRSRDGNSPSGSGGRAAAMDAMLRMLEAKQKAVREQASAAQADLEQLPAQSASAAGQARDEAGQSLGQAIEDMKKLEERLADARYESAMSPQDEQAAVETAEAASRRLAEAGRAIQRGLSAGKQKTPGEQAQEWAEQLAEDAEAFDESLSPVERERMLERLEAARRLLESGADPRWASITGSGTPSGTLVYTHGGSLTPAEIARMLAQQFWSMAVEARSGKIQPVAEEPSDAEFFQAEKEFFERAAQFKARQ
jgi:hypothetical protein